MLQFNVVFKFLFLLTLSSCVSVNCESLFKNCNDQQRLVLDNYGSIIYCSINNELESSNLKLQWSIKFDIEDNFEVVEYDDKFPFRLQKNGLHLNVTEDYFQKAIFKVSVIDESNGEVIEQKIIKVILNKWPVIVLQKEITVQLWDLVEVECTSDGIPKPKISWFNKFSVLIPSVNNTYLVKLIASKEDAGLYKCKAENEIGMSTSTILIKLDDHAEEDNPPLDIEMVKILDVTKTSFKFEVRPSNKGPNISSIFATYHIIGKKGEVFNVTWKIENSSNYTIKNLKGGASYRFSFAPVGLTGLHGPWHPRPVDVFLLPPKPELFIKNADDKIINIFWLTAFSGITDANPVDSYELRYSKLQRRGDNWNDAECLVTISLPTCEGSQYTFLRRSGSSYYLKFEIRAHNKGGFSDWDSVLLAPL